MGSGSLEGIWALLLALLAVGVVLYLCYLFSRYLAAGATKITKSKYIKVVDRVVLGQDKLLFIAQIGEKYYLIGSSSNSVHILTELDSDCVRDNSPQADRLSPDGGGFQSILNSFLTKKE